MMHVFTNLGILIGMLICSYLFNDYGDMLISYTIGIFIGYWAYHLLKKINIIK